MESKSLTTFAHPQLASAIVEASPDGILLVDENGVLVEANGRVVTMFGYERADLIGRKVEDLVPERHAGIHRAHRTRYGAAPEPRSMGSGLDLWARRADGSEFPVEISLSPLRTETDMVVITTVRDVSERYERDAESHAVLHIMNSALDGVFIFDPASLRFRYANEGATKQLGYSNAELLAMTPLHIKPEFTEERFRELLTPLVDGSLDSLTFSTTHRRKDGGDVPVEIVLEFPQSRDPGRPRNLVAVVRDITERLESARAVEASELAFRTAFDAAPVGMALVDFSDPVFRPIRRVNAALCSLLGYAEDQLLSMGFSELTHPDDAEVSELRAREAASGETPSYAIEKRYLTADGEPVWVWVHSAVLERGDESPVSVLVHVVDLTEARKIRNHEARLGVLEDRERLAEDLHDLIIQRLFAAGMGLQSIQRLVHDPIAEERVSSTVDELDHAIADLRSTIFKLHSPTMEGAISQIQSTVDAVAVSLGFEPSLSVVGNDPDSIPGVVLEQLLPTLNEALTNASKHANANKLEVELVVGDMIELHVVDDGVGSAADTSFGNGLRNIRARAERLGGTVRTKSSVGGGFAVGWCVPADGRTGS